ncbi:MAG: MFS transporter [Cyclobacteriaceae bacterium]
MKSYSRNFWLLCVSGLLFFASFSIMIPDLPSHLTAMGGEDHIGLIIFLFTVSALVSRPFSGKLADEWGRLPVMVFGALVSTLAALMYPFATTIWFFFFVRIFHGFCTGFKPTGTAAYVADIVPAKSRGAAMGIVGFASNLGTALAMAGGPLITQYFGINYLFATSCVLGILSVLVLSGMKETLQDRKKLNLDRLKVTKNDFFEPKVLIPATMLLLTVYTFGTVLTLGPNISDALLLPSRGIYIFSYVVASLLVRIAAGKLSDIYGRVAVLRIAVPVITVAAVLMGTAQGQVQFIAASILLGLGIGMSSPAIYAWTIDLSDEKFRGRGIATMYIFLEAGIGIGALLSGYLYSFNNNNTIIPFLLSAVLTAIAFVYLMFSNKKRIENQAG